MLDNKFRCQDKSNSTDYTQQLIHNKVSKNEASLVLTVSAKVQLGTFCVVGKNTALWKKFGTIEALPCRH